MPSCQNGLSQQVCAPFVVTGNILETPDELKRCSAFTPILLQDLMPCNMAFVFAILAASAAMGPILARLLW